MEMYKKEIYRTYFDLVEVIILFGEGGEKKDDLGLDNGVYVGVRWVVHRRRPGRGLRASCDARRFEQLGWR
jgi:hypothetical protein